MNITSKVSINDVHKCYDFAEKMYHNQAASTKQFGSKILRKKEDYIADHVRGKIVEFGFKNFMKNNLNLDFEVDLKIYDGHHNHDDGNDLETVYIKGEKYSFNFKTDIKGIASNSQWLLIEKHKFWAKIYVVCKITNFASGKDFEKKLYDYRDKEWHVDILGYAYNKDIIHKDTQLPWIGFRKGEKLYKGSLINSLKPQKEKLDPKEFEKVLKSKLNETSSSMSYIGFPLDCEYNYGYPIKWLRQNWDSFKSLIENHSEIKEN
ncbi:hypothetical protein PO903_09825 [Paenibacillus sp. PK4536]|uniref:hypothetical protein n=1 Tax=Paenibacillus sp. PK4536 TaxID=3024576 RepID=UPI0023587506|nr:hypothetical protein [Paenibacillus sp. PK4536]WIM41143.1 hypothetical protein PO903_09825 [Paenibacillus sp. PK4536]